MFENGDTLFEFGIVECQRNYIYMSRVSKLLPSLLKLLGHMSILLLNYFMKIEFCEIKSDDYKTDHALNLQINCKWAFLNMTLILLLIRK